MTGAYRAAFVMGAIIGGSILSLGRAQTQQSEKPQPDVQSKARQQKLSDLGYAPAPNLQTNYQLLKSRLQTAQQELDRTRELYKNGQVPQGELTKAEATVAQLSIEFSAAAMDVEAGNFRAKLQQPVNIQLDHASVKQFATALTKATGVAVTVDKNVAEDASTMLTLDAQQVPFGNVLEAIAEKTDLMISRDSKGVVLQKWPHLNGRVFRSPIAPWNQEWGAPPTMSGGQGGLNPFGRGAGDGPQNGQFGFGAAGGQAPGGLQFTGPGQPGEGNPGMPGMGISRGPQPQGPGFAPFQMTSLGGNAVVIAEPGHDRQGNPGVWMTAYRFGPNNQFTRISSMFHPFMNNGMPGGPGPGGLQPGALQPRPGQANPFRAPGTGGGPPAGLQSRQPGSPGADVPNGGVLPPGSKPGQNPLQGDDQAKSGLPGEPVKPGSNGLPGGSHHKGSNALPGAAQPAKPGTEPQENK